MPGRDCIDDTWLADAPWLLLVESWSKYPAAPRGRARGDMTEEDGSLLTAGYKACTSLSMAPEGQNDSDGSLVIVAVIDEE